jgi:hypothetical protein
LGELIELVAIDTAFITLVQHDTGTPFSLPTKMRTAKQNSRPEGRPTKKVGSVINALLKSVESGLPFTLCCQIAGVHYDTFLVWRKEDPAFGQQVDKAAAKAAARLLSKIERQARNNFAAAAWILERRFPELFSRPEVQLSVSNTANHNALSLTISLEEAERLEAESAPIREAARQMIEQYLQRRNGAGSPNGDVSAERVDADQSSGPTIPEQARARLDQYLRDRR